MKKFKVTASYITYLIAEINADSLEEACELAKDLDGGSFEDKGGYDWNIDGVVEIKQ